MDREGRYVNETGEPESRRNGLAAVAKEARSSGSGGVLEGRRRKLAELLGAPLALRSAP